MAEPDGAGVVLYNGAKVLLQKRDDQPKLFPNYWTVFGGQIDGGEEPEATACREIKEELGFDIDPALLHYLGSIRAMRGSEYITVHYFASPLVLDLRELKLSEGDGFAYFRQDELHFLLMLPEDRLALERHFATQGFGWIDSV
jgi:8-oxo-dGTP pyrophosphatase MutT (NUDIX family)